MADAAETIEVRQEPDVLQHASASSEDNSKGENVTEGINWEEVKVDDIPVDLLKQSKAYKDLMSESVERRQTIKRMRDAMNEPEEETSAEPQEITLTSLQEQLTQLTTILVQRDTDTARNMIAAEFNIPENLQKYIQGDSAEAMKESAEELSKAFAQPTGNNSSPTNAGVQEPVSRAREAIKRQMEVAEDFTKLPGAFSNPMAMRSGGVGDPLAKLLE